MSRRLNSSHYYGVLVVASAVTPVHAGAGRGYGVVDLPIQRDALGYPEIWASSIKGALKSHLLKIFDNDPNAKNAVLGFFGSEPEETPTVPGLAMLHNLVPLAIPVPSITHGFLYVSTPYLLARVKSYIEIVEQYPANLACSKIDKNLFTMLKKLVEEVLGRSRTLNDNEVLVTNPKIKGSVSLGTIELQVKEDDCTEITCFGTSIESLHPLYKVKNVIENLVVVNDKLGRNIIESAIQRVYRVRLDRITKTIERGALWSEEYLPTGTLLIGLILWQDPCKAVHRIEKKIDEAKRRGREEEANNYEKFKKFYEALCKESKDNSQRCNQLEKIIQKLNENYIIVGGKETIGRGILKLVLTLPSDTKSQSSES